MATQIDKNFSAACLGIRNLCTAIATALVSGSYPAPGLGCTARSGSLVRKFFARDGLAKDYSKAIESAGTVADLQSAKLQSDLLSSLERDFKLSRRSRIRSLAAEASRRSAHGAADGPVAKGIQYYPQMILQRNGIPTEESSQ
jgi:hypothetical protein